MRGTAIRLECPRHERAVDSGPGPPGRSRWSIYVVAAAVYVLLGARSTRSRSIFPDELVYGHLARSVAAGDGLSWYGADQSWPMALYIYLLAPSWLLASGESAYELAKVTGALLACTVVFPVWVLARALMPRPARPRSRPCSCVAGTWMLSAAGLLTENLALPLSTAALAATVLALRDRRQPLALGGARVRRCWRPRARADGDPVRGPARALLLDAALAPRLARAA